MKQHPPLESLSALIDDELTEAERTRLESHFQICDECNGRMAELSSAASSVASLVAVEMTAKERRRLHDALAAARKAGRAVHRRRLPRRWLAPGLAGTAAAVLAGIGLFVVRDPAPRPDPPKVIASETLQINDPSDIRRAVDRLPHVREAVGRFSAEDVGEGTGRSVEAPSTSTQTTEQIGGEADAGGHQGAAPQRSRTAGAPEAAYSGAEDAVAPPQNTSVADPEVAGRQFQPPRGHECLRKVASAQPYPVLPLLAQKAEFVGRPAWLLTFASTDSTDPEAKLDQIQVWLFSPSDCAALSGPLLLDRALHRSTF